MKPALTILPVLFMFGSCFSAIEEVSPAGTDTKSTTTAYSVSLVGTALPGSLGLVLISQGRQEEYGFDATLAADVVLAGFAVTCGPGLGYAYTGDYSRLRRGSGTRLIGGLAGTFGVIVLADKNSDRKGLAGLATAAGGGLWLYATVRDLIHLRRAAKACNDRHEAWSVNVSPALLGGRRTSAGMSICVRF